MFGLSFLNSFFLWGLLAASIPLLIHLVKRNRAAKLHFAAIRFLQLEPNQRIRSQRWKQLLLLLMRITAFALLALAFARPFFAGKGPASVWGSQPKAVVVLLDASFSMGFERGREKALEQAAEVFSSLRSGDKVTVMQFGETTRTLVEADKELGGVLDKVEAGYAISNEGTEYGQALLAAETALFESPFEVREIYLISDFQKRAWDELRPQWRPQPGVRLHVLPVSRPAGANVAVVDLRVARDEHRARRGDVLVRVRNLGDTRTRAGVSLHMAGRRLGKRRVLLEPGGEQIVRFDHVRVPAGAAAGYAEVTAKNDLLLADNRTYFVLGAKPKSQILAVDGEPNAGDVTRDELFFVERAVNLPKLARYHLVSTAPSGIDRFDFNDYRAVLFANVKNLSRPTIRRLQAYVRSGGGLILSLGDQVNAAIFNRLFRDLAPGQITEPRFKTPQRQNARIISEVDYHHPIFRLFADPGQSDPSSAQFYQYLQMTPFKADAVLASFDDGGAAVLERQVGEGKVVVFTSTLDTEWTDLPVKAFFLPLLYRTLEYVVKEMESQKVALVGEPVSLPGLTGGRLEEGMRVITPAGDALTPGGPLFDRTDQPGIFEVRRGDSHKLVARFAVNVDPRESDLTRADERALEMASDTVDERQVQTASLVSGQADGQQEKRQKLWRLLVFAIILLLIGETWLANRTYR